MITSAQNTLCHQFFIPIAWLSINPPNHPLTLPTNLNLFYREMKEGNGSDQRETELQINFTPYSIFVRRGLFVTKRIVT